MQMYNLPHYKWGISIHELASGLNLFGIVRGLVKETQLSSEYYFSGNTHLFHTTTI